MPISALKSQAKWTADQERRIKVEKWLDFYWNNHNPINRYTILGLRSGYLDEIIDSRLDNQEAIILKKYIEIENLTERIVNDSSLMFRVSPQISLENGTKKMQDNFDELLEMTNFYTLLREINKFTNLCYDIHVIPQIRDKKMYIDIITPDICFVEQQEEDPTKAKSIYYQIGIYEDSPQIEDTIETYIVWNEEGKFKIEIDNTGQINENKKEEIVTIDYKGKIPVVLFRNYIPIFKYWYPGENYVVDRNIQIDLRMTALNMLEDWNLPQKVRIGIDKAKEGKLGLTFTEDIERNDEGEAIGSVGYIRPDAPVQDERELIEWRILQVANSLGLSVESFKGNKFSSGYELFLSKSEIIEKNKEERPYYRDSIVELLEIMMITAEGLKMRFPDKPEIAINFGELTFAQSPEEKERARAMKKQSGTWSAVQSIMEDDPDLTEEQAIEKVEKIKVWNEIGRPKSPFEEEIEEEK